jgi:hypothetical protein
VGVSKFRLCEAAQTDDVVVVRLDFQVLFGAVVDPHVKPLSHIAFSTRGSPQIRDLPERQVRLESPAVWLIDDSIATDSTNDEVRRVTQESLCSGRLSAVAAESGPR